MRIHQCISGFTQDIGTEHGIIKLSEYLKRAGHDDGMEQRVFLHTWNSNWKRVAEYYSILAEKYLQPMTVCIYAYSWGAGWGAMRLSYFLGHVGLGVRVMVLSDPVYRHPNMFLRWTALMQRDWFNWSPIIRVPQNVSEAFSLHQRNNRPQGHRLIGTNGTRIHPSYLVTDCDHQHMDNCWEFHSLSLEVAKRIKEGVDLYPMGVASLDLGDYL